jgi:hypothetical protein
MIDLVRFSSPKIGVAPVLDKQGQFRGRKFRINLLTVGTN